MSAAKRARAVGFNHVAIEVGDIDEALAFYGRLFEFELRSKSDSMAFIDLGDQFLALQKGRIQPADDGRHFGLVVDDREAARKALIDGASRSCPGHSSTSSTPGETAWRSSRTTTFSSPKRRMCCAVWGSATFQRTTRQSRSWQKKVWRLDEPRHSSWMAVGPQSTGLRPVSRRRGQYMKEDRFNPSQAARPRSRHPRSTMLSLTGKPDRYEA